MYRSKVKISILKQCGKWRQLLIENFLHLPQCFQKSPAAEASESVCVMERVKIKTRIKTEHAITEINLPAEERRLKKLN